MTKKFRLLLLDANVVIELFSQGIWDRVVDACDVHLSRTVAETEAHFFVDASGKRKDFSLREYETQGKITVFDVPLSDVRAFRSKFGPSYLESLDPGEAESLAFLFASDETCLICSADKIVYRVLGNTHRPDQGISLEEVLVRIGLGRPLARPYGKQYREHWTGVGSREAIQERGWDGV